MTQGVGLSVGATKFAAVIPGCAAVTRQSVLTLYRHRPPEVGGAIDEIGDDKPALVEPRVLGWNTDLRWAVPVQREDGLARDGRAARYDGGDLGGTDG